MIIQNEPVITELMTLEEARQAGAIDLFDEKYSNRVRVVSVGSLSKELCGGTHLKASAEAGQFRLVSESGIASGVRRIEGVTGAGAWQLARQQQDELEALGGLLKTKPADLLARAQQLLDQLRDLKQARSQDQQAKR
ncbi:MAG: alanine--tRNA ligase, partial [Acholeplasmataceae bacterium]|nr:alanine--tRNA ligase [Acholeplasmataceae bacterium]